jgi:hypothetical protein
MRFGVVRIEHDQHRFIRRNRRLHRADDRGIDRAAFEERDERRQRMCFDRDAVVRPDLDVNSDDPPASEEFAEAGVEDERAAVGDAGLDDHVRLHAIDDFL